MLETIAIMATTMVVFLIGINAGYRLKKDEKPVELPKIEEIKKNIPFTQENKEFKEKNKEEKKIVAQNQEEINRLNKIERNLQIYDGTNNGQMEVK